MTTESRAAIDTVESIMSKNVQTVGLNTSVSDALRIMAEDNFNAIPVVNGEGRCVGMLSRADLTETLFSEDLELAKMLESGAFNQWHAGMTETCDQKLVREVMTHDVKSVTQETPIKNACEIMSNNQIHHLPVVSDQEFLLGILSTSDVINWLAE